MKLLLDLGNSRLKWGAWDNGVWRAEGSRVLGDEAPDEIARWLQSLPQPEGIWLASVAADERAGRVMQACQNAFGISPVRVRTPASACGMRCAYAEPSRLGIDRWLAVLGAFREFGGPAVVFDCGTAITVDAVTGEGQHLGGLIIPGMSLMRRALYSTASGIPDEGEGDVGLLARDTRSAVTGGTLYAAVAFVQHIAAELQGHLGKETRLVLTGGDADRLAPLLQAHFEMRPRLVLEGLLAMVVEGQCGLS